MSGSIKPQAHTPVMQQYLRAKAQHPDSILFFRLGDFYEMFFEDAVEASKLLKITLTSRSKSKDGNNIPMAGVPHHAATTYIAKLLDLGKKVALCEQMADPSSVKGVVPREVVQVITPGLVTDPDALDARTNNFLLSVFKLDSEYGIAAFDCTTSELHTSNVSTEPAALAEIMRLGGREVLLWPTMPSLTTALNNLTNPPLVHTFPQKPPSSLNDYLRSSHKKLTPQIEGAATMALEYARQNRKKTIHVDRVLTYQASDRLWLDELTIKHLELLQTYAGQKRGSLLEVIDHTKTPMGSRLLRRRLLAPSRDKQQIETWHKQIQFLLADGTRQQELRATTATIPDLNRLATRAESEIATPKEVASIRDGLFKAQALLSIFRKAPNRVWNAVLNTDSCQDIGETIQRTLSEAPGTQIGIGTILEGFDANLDELRNLAKDGQSALSALEARERKNTGINKLKVRYTRVFGYFIEITKSQLQSVPKHYTRKQTLANAERFTTPELQVLQQQLTTASEQAISLEESHFQKLRRTVGKEAYRIRELAEIIASIDVSISHATCATKHGYVQPTLLDSPHISLKQCRHPVVEQLAASGNFVPNDIELGAEQRFMMITGPNMAGKSTIMRQVALCVILAQAGSFVPASKAKIGLLDQVFTRIGASDNVAQGQSTFMVEMVETARLLGGATNKSLVIVDEIGRGTSAEDGKAIAWAVAEHLHTQVECLTLFSTHYHELSALGDKLPNMTNYNVMVHEENHNITFLYRLSKGATDRSYGLEVARLAGLPQTILQRAAEVLATHPSSEQQRLPLPPIPEANVTKTPIGNLLEKKLASLCIDELRPIDALIQLQELQKTIQPLKS